MVFLSTLTITNHKIIHIIFLISFPLFKGSTKADKKPGFGKSKRKKQKELDKRAAEASELKAIIQEMVEELEAIPPNQPQPRQQDYYPPNQYEQDPYQSQNQDYYHYGLKQARQKQHAYASKENVYEQQAQAPEPKEKQQRILRPTEESSVEYDEAHFFSPVATSKETEQKTDQTLMDWEAEQEKLQDELQSLDALGAESEDQTIKKPEELEAQFEIIEPESIHLEPLQIPEEKSKKKVLMPDEKIEKYYHMAEKYRNRNQYHEAIKYYDMVLAINPEHIDTLNNKGLILWENCKYRLAIEHFNRILDIDPENQDVIINIAASLNRLGHREKALKMYDTLLNRDDKNSDAWSNKGVIFFQLEQYSDAEECFRHAVMNSPEDEELWFNMGITFEKLEKFDEAVDAYEHVLKLNPEHSEAKDAMEQCSKAKRRKILIEWD